MILKKYPILHTQVSNLGQKYLKIHFWPKYFTLELNILNQNRTADFFVRLKIPCHFGDPWHSGPTISWTFLTQILVLGLGLGLLLSDLSPVHFWDGELNMGLPFTSKLLKAHLERKVTECNRWI